MECKKVKMFKSDCKSRVHRKDARPHLGRSRMEQKMESAKGSGFVRDWRFEMISMGVDFAYALVLLDHDYELRRRDGAMACSLSCALAMSRVYLCGYGPFTTLEVETRLSFRVLCPALDLMLTAMAFPASAPFV